MQGRDQRGGWTHLSVGFTREVGVGLIAHFAAIIVVVVLNHSFPVNLCPQASYDDVVYCNGHFGPREVLTIAED